MNTQSLRMVDDSLEPDYVREILQAGIYEEVTGYDFEKGLNRHLALIASGALPPSWAKSSGLTKIAATSSVKTAALWLGLPVASVGLVAAVMLTGSEPRVTSVKPTMAATKSVSKPEPAKVVPEISAGQREDQRVVEPAAHLPRRTPAESYHARHSVLVDPTERLSIAKPLRPKIETSKPVLSSAARFEINANPYKTGSFGTGSTSASSNASRPATASSASVKVRRDDIDKRPRNESENDKDNASSEKIQFTLQPFVQVQEKRPETKKEDPYEREMRLLAAANRLVHSDPQRALDLIQSGEREFADGLFAQERRHLMVLALVKLGRTEEARRVGLNYLRQYPTGPFSERVRRALATGQVPEE
jgi:hypothetical protein